MSVQFSGSAAFWTYDAFHDFRRKLAREIGVPLGLMDGYVKGKGIAWTNFNDALTPLLACEDIGATFTPTQCKSMAVRLKQVTHSWLDADEDKFKAFSLATLMDGHSQFDIPLTF